MERAALAAAAPYYAPRLSAIAMGTTQLDKEKEHRADPREALLEMIMQFRDRDEAGQKVLPASKSNGPIIDVVAEVVEEDEGEAA